MDEPTSSLDPISTLSIEELMASLADEYAIVVVTHNMQQAARVSDYSAFMLADETGVGRLIEVGEPPSVYQAVAAQDGRLHYRTLRLSRFG